METMYRARLYFGTEVPPAQQDRLQKKALLPFDRSALLGVLAREFPAGFTVYDARGHWAGPDGRTVGEDTIVAEIIGNAEVVERARYVGRWHKHANGQDAVLLTVETLSDFEFL